jgi:hypothetical protein
VHASGLFAPVKERVNLLHHKGGDCTPKWLSPHNFIKLTVLRLKTARFVASWGTLTYVGPVAHSSPVLA